MGETMDREQKWLLNFDEGKDPMLFVEHLDLKVVTEFQNINYYFLYQHFSEGTSWFGTENKLATFGRLYHVFLLNFLNKLIRRNQIPYARYT